MTKFDGMGTKTPLQRKRYGWYGHATLNLDRAMLRPWIKAASKLLPDEVVREFAGILSTLPTARPQGSMNGLRPVEKAEAIMWHIVKQRSSTLSLETAPTEQRGIDKAARLILASAAAVMAYEPKPTSSPMFLKVQTGRAIYRLLRADYLQLYGKAHRVRIAMQSHKTACELFKIVQPMLYFWLKDGGRKAMVGLCSPSMFSTTCIDLPLVTG